MDLITWELIRAAGLIAFGLLTLSVFMGVAVNARALDGVMKRAWANEVHGTAAVLGAVFIVLHVGLVLVDQYVPFSLAAAFVPLASSWRPWPVAAGIVSLYLATILLVSTYLRPAIGYRTWRLIHYGGFLGWAAALLHGITAGSDAGVAWMQYMYLLAGGAVALVTIFRVLAPSPPASGGLPESRRP